MVIITNTAISANAEESKVEISFVLPNGDLETSTELVHGIERIIKKVNEEIKGKINSSNLLDVIEFNAK